MCMGWNEFHRIDTSEMKSRNFSECPFDGYFYNVIPLTIVGGLTFIRWKIKWSNFFGWQWFAFYLQRHSKTMWVHAFVQLSLYSENFWCGWEKLLKKLLWFKRCVTWTPNELLHFNNERYICSRCEVENVTRSTPLNCFFLSIESNACKFSFEL